MSLTVKKVLNIFGSDINAKSLIHAAEKGLVPSAKRSETAKNGRRLWEMADLPGIGERYGFLKKIQSPTVVTIFTTKGGVLKTTLAMNLARLAALHNNRVCIVGLDMQCDITHGLGFQADLDESESLQEAIEKISSVVGLEDFASGDANLEDIILDTDIPTLKFIPETPGLVSLEREISTKTMRDTWLREHVVNPLKERFDLIVIDCSPNWNLLISNAIMAADVLISPLECKINNFRNYTAFKTYLDGFRQVSRHDFKHIFVPTKLSTSRKLSGDIRSWYLSNVPGCTQWSIRECVQGEEANAVHLSVVEFAPKTVAAEEMRELMKEIWQVISSAANGKTSKKSEKKSKSLSIKHDQSLGA